jgi:hypothetical protein
MNFVAIAGLYALLLFGPPAQTPTVQGICGTVQDQTGAPLAGANVELNAADSRVEAKTDEAGRFCFDQLEGDEYRLTVQARGFRTYEKRLTAHSGESVRLTVILALETVSQQVTVAEGAANAGSLNVAQTEIGTGLIQNLPSESVNAALSSILTLATPGVAAD